MPKYIHYACTFEIYLIACIPAWFLNHYALPYIWDKGYRDAIIRSLDRLYSKQRTEWQEDQKTAVEAKNVADKKKSDSESLQIAYESGISGKEKRCIFLLHRYYFNF